MDILNAGLLNSLGSRTSESGWVERAPDARPPLPFFEFFENVPLGVFVIDADSVIIECNDLFLAMAGSPRNKVVGFNLLRSSKDQSLIPYLRRALAGEQVGFDTPYTSTTGKYSSHYYYFFQPLNSPSGSAARVLCFAQDIAQIKFVEETNAALKLSEEKFSKAFRNSPDPMIISSVHDGLIYEINDGFTKSFGYTAAELIGRTTLEIGLWPDSTQRERIVMLMNEQDSLRNYEHDLRTRDGRIVAVLGSANKVAINERLYWLVQLRDITERKSLMVELEKQANSDYLTGLPNRRHFMQLAEQELQRAYRYDRPLSMLMLDLDHFKWLNDQHGHLSGDDMLQRVGECFSLALREHDLIGRIGGEEFAALLPETDLPQAIEVAQRVCQLTAGIRLTTMTGAEISTTVSIGIATTRPERESIDALLSRSDRALYRAKAEGRNCWKADTENSNDAPSPGIGN